MSVERHAVGDLVGRLAASIGEAVYEDVSMVRRPPEPREFDGKTEPWDAFWGRRFAYLCDPDGNTVALFAPLA